MLVTIHVWKNSIDNFSIFNVPERYKSKKKRKKERETL